MKHIATSQENASGLQRPPEHRHRALVNTRATGGSELEIILPETCLVTHLALQTKTPQSKPPLRPKLQVPPLLADQMTLTDQQNPAAPEDLTRHPVQNE